jgi:myo-inositol-1(or 4)-monophosphatase
VPVNLTADDALRAAVAAARAAGTIAMASWGEAHEIREKEQRADIVTEVDRESEDVILARLRSDYPTATYVTEESGLHAGACGERWIVDPIDGTTNFAHGYPLFCVSIAFERDGELEAGVIFAPAVGELFTATRGGGAALNGRALRVSTIADVGDALVCTGFQPARVGRNLAHFRAMSNRAQAVRRDGSAALDLAYVACGRYDAFWEFDLHAWDVAAGTLLVREAGGMVTRVDGDPATLDGASILASNGRIHDAVREILLHDDGERDGLSGGS